MGMTQKSIIRRASSSFKNNASFVARLPTIRRHKSQSLHSPGNAKPPVGPGIRPPRGPRISDMNNSNENLGKYKTQLYYNSNTKNFNLNTTNAFLLKQIEKLIRKMLALTKLNLFV